MLVTIKEKKRFFAPCILFSELANWNKSIRMIVSGNWI
jgi:hypothetical protein